MPPKSETVITEKDLSPTLQAKRKLTQNANLEYLKQVNEYANLAYLEGQAKGYAEAIKELEAEETSKIQANAQRNEVLYAISILEMMEDRCDTVEETIDGLQKCIGVGPYANIAGPPLDDDDSPF